MWPQTCHRIRASQNSDRYTTAQVRWEFQWDHQECFGCSVFILHSSRTNPPGPNNFRIMRLYYVIFAITATVLVSTNAVSADAQQDQISQTVSEIVAATQIDNRVKRSLRAHKDDDVEEEEGSIDSLNDSEERGGGGLYRLAERQ
ncbi:hypothetical protein PI125_g24273 [Phytophthora idaei]|nr:hypothetical protein PI125_g24273 [Phytophthora idaei]